MVHALGSAKQLLKKSRASLLAIALLSISTLAGCGQPPQITEAEALMAGSTGSPASQAADVAQTEAPARTPPLPPPGTLMAASPAAVPQPQLMRTAELSVTVESAETAITSATTIARQQQGEVMNLQDQTPPAGDRHIASMQLRVPQTKLDVTLTALAELGTVQQQTLKAEDVSEQLVDFEARLRNLRRAEETVLKIMERSGNVGDVLKVVQELNMIRQNIEQINAQLSSLQTRVSYSTIDLRLVTAITPVSAPTPVQTQLTNTWNSATQSIAKVTVDLMQLGIWLMVYSPYLLLIGGAATLVYWRRQRSSQPETQE